MHKISNIKILIVVGIAALAVLIFSTAIRSCSNEKIVLAKVSHVLAETNQTISFADSTKGAHEWLWEFGNGDKLSSPRGQYQYREAGKYQIRLTVNNEREKYFLIEVKDPVDTESENSIISIYAPSKAMQNELVIFKGIGNAEKWRWEFGETGMVDSREKKTLYAYSQPGLYDVLLSTETTKYPIRHQIEVIAQYQENDTTDVLSLIGLDIKDNLQAIALGKSFNLHYNKILNKYLCQDANTLVVINNNKYNDFYSYCQGLKIVGKTNHTIIENVLVDLDKANNTCIDKITVIQYDSNQQIQKP